MNDQNFINFKKQRDLGTMLSDTFKFLNTEWKPFFATILKISIIPILIAICAVVYYTMSSVSFIGDISEASNYDSLNLNFSDLVIPTSALLLSYLVAYALITIATLSYIKSYIDHKGLVNYQEIQDATKVKFWPYVGLFFLVSLIILVGSIFCFLPGIYFWVVLSVSFCLVIFQNKGVLESISDSFSFIKEHWWETFGILIVVQLIILAISYVADIPAAFYQTADITTILKDQDTTELLNAFTDPIYLTLIAFSYFVKFILYILSTIVTVFVFFDIKEQKNPSSDIIDEIGFE
ncbi:MULTISPECIES: hypothetical protein [unclassified Polaribacter]|uniref:hypothetical protein n=1 Tax=unclassified Polaribacter TaxID=196858 RepID=UPI0011BF118C|nr:MULTISPECIES: hypothetical protein [unclassified Polaribacter]TXD52131.1 hypothetical protein ES043_09215 [Polaribacter sp. IC063]TXD59985.1 hypothetical protein ES044_08705 [Polaribacter sp. IC066]